MNTKRCSPIGTIVSVAWFSGQAAALQTSINSTKAVKNSLDAQGKS